MQELTQAAQVAKLIKLELKESFPSTKFNVISKSNIFTEAVWIKWAGDVKNDEVRNLTNKYQFGFNDENFPKVTVICLDKNEMRL